MKKAIVLAGLILCVSGVYAAESRSHNALEGKQRNEEAYERMLEQTGWKNERAARMDRPVQPNDRDQNPQSAPSKRS
jgi:hypothetical protein